MPLGYSCIVEVCMSSASHQAYLTIRAHQAPQQLLNWPYHRKCYYVAWKFNQCVCTAYNVIVQAHRHLFANKSFSTTHAFNLCMLSYSFVVCVCIIDIFSTFWINFNRTGATSDKKQYIGSLTDIVCICRRWFNWTWIITDTEGRYTARNCQVQVFGLLGVGPNDPIKLLDFRLCVATKTPLFLSRKRHFCTFVGLWNWARASNRSCSRDNAKEFLWH